jgi:Co/Zn/Cd efflux system component
VLADALTSLLAIAALAGGWLRGWSWLDPVMGLVGAALVAAWAKNLLAQTGRVLLDREMDHPVVAEIHEVIDALPGGATQVTDLHVWRIGTGQYACALSVLTHDAALTPLAVREALGVHEELVHVTVEIHRCDECSDNAPVR